MGALATGFCRQNEWATSRVIEVCRGLSDDQLDATTIGTFGSIRDTLRHIVSSEGAYAHRLGHEPSPRLRDDDPWPGFDAVAEMASATAAGLAAASETVTDRVIRVGSEAESYDVEAAVILIQAFQHGTDHRSQICTILTTLGIDPPELSSWEWALDVGRMRRV